MRAQKQSQQRKTSASYYTMSKPTDDHRTIDCQSQVTLTRFGCTEYCDNAVSTADEQAMMRLRYRDKLQVQMEGNVQLLLSHSDNLSTCIAEDVRLLRQPKSSSVVERYYDDAIHNIFILFHFKSNERKRERTIAKPLLIGYPR